MNHVDTHLASRRPEPGRPAEATFLDAARQSIVVEFIAHLRNGSGLMVLLGQPGSGRSTILRQVAREAAAQQLPLLAPLDESDAMSALIDAFDRLGSPAAASMTRNRRPAGILIDDAEACPVAVWHKLAGLLRHRPAAAAPAPPIILALPPEMLHWLRDLALIDPAALDARVRRLDPLPPADVGQYVAQRLGAAGHMPPSYSLPTDVIERIAAATRGLPGPLDAFCGALIGLTRLRGGGWVSMEMIETALAAAAGAAPSQPPGQAKPAETPALRAAPPKVAAATVPPPPISPAVATAAPAVSPTAAAAAIPPLHATPSPTAPTLKAPASATPFAEEPPVRPPLFPDDARGGTLFQSSRRRRWPWIAGGAGLAIVALAVAGALYVPASDDSRATVHPQPAAPAMVPSMAERIDSGPTPSPVPPSAEAAPPPMPTIARDVVESTTPPSPTDTPAVDTEEPPVVFEPVKPISRPAAEPPPASPTTKVKAAATPAPVDDAAKQPAATKQPTAAHSTPASTRTSTNTSTQKRPAAPSPGDDTASEANAVDGEDPLTPPRPAHELIEIGDDFRGAGDMAWARKYYEAAQQQGSAKATRALAETYDPRLVNGSDRPDPARARDLYEQAAKKGDGGAVKEREDLDQWLSEGQ